MFRGLTDRRNHHGGGFVGVLLRDVPEGGLRLRPAVGRAGRLFRRRRGRFYGETEKTQRNGCCKDRTRLCLPRGMLDVFLFYFLRYGRFYGEAEKKDANGYRKDRTRPSFLGVHVFFYFLFYFVYKDQRFRRKKEPACLVRVRKAVPMIFIGRALCEKTSR